VWVVRLVVRLVRRIDRHRGELAAFFATVATTDVVAPPTGLRTVEDHFDSLARAGLSYRNREPDGRRVRAA
jgi:hypothetical protein